MYLKTLQTILSSFLLCTMAFEDVLHVYGMEMNEMTQKGKIQYQLLQERGNLPQYGDCWKNAIRKVDDGCKELSEETQSEVALYLTNCFLAMSGHEIYKCEADKKPNLRGICISTMSDRAFNVYTEFYTHTLNICYFLRGQIWHETIAENTVKLGKQLHDSAVNLEELLKIQKESIELQKNMKEFFVYLTEKHKDFDILTSNFKELQSWLMGKISWVDSFVFYFITSTLTMFITSLNRTVAARFYMLVTIMLNLFIERVIGTIISNRITNIFDLNQKYYYIISLLRYLVIVILIFLFIYSYFKYVQTSPEDITAGVKGLFKKKCVCTRPKRVRFRFHYEKCRLGER
nr:uncharacterized protein LOC111426771 [Onthophagus taurus]